MMLPPLELLLELGYPLLKLKVPALDGGVPTNLGRGGIARIVHVRDARNDALRRRRWLSACAYGQLVDEVVEVALRVWKVYHVAGIEGEAWPRGRRASEGARSRREAQPSRGQIARGDRDAGDHVRALHGDQYRDRYRQRCGVGRIGTPPSKAETRLLASS